MAGRLEVLEDRLTRVRRVGALAIWTGGLVDVASAMTPPLRARLTTIAEVVPLAVPQVASALVALAGIALLLTARGVRRGQRHAWVIAVALLSASAGLHFAKGLDVEEGVLSLGIVTYLVLRWRAFDVPADRPSTRSAATALVVGGVTAVAAGSLGIWFTHFPTGAHLAFGRAVEGAAERLVGVDAIAIPHRAQMLVGPTLLTFGVGLVVAVGWLLFRPLTSPLGGAGRDRAIDVVRRHGGSTLAYFALRDDKQWFFWRDTLVAYAVVNGVALVSPDPIGPADQRDGAWLAFRRFADAHGWSVAVLAAGESWLPIYRRNGMRDVYIGDEAVVDVATFSLDGGKNKGLRQAVNRIAKYGYTISFHDPAHLDPELAGALRALMSESRRGDVERGFSMTLGRVFDERDEGLLLAVATGPDGRPAAFCQYVPAPDIDGYSLDLMRRSAGEHPNGLTDFVVVRTIEHLRALGRHGLGLNFATMRGVLAGERGSGPVRRIERWLVGLVNDSMQIESLWRYNAKFHPQWVARYAVYSAPEHLLPQAFAVAKAESWWELPVVGRFLGRAA